MAGESVGPGELPRSRHRLREYSQPAETANHKNHNHAEPGLLAIFAGEYARGWMVRDNGAGKWWHSGGLPGSTTVMVRTATGLCWAPLTNKRAEPSDETGADLDKMVWDMVRQVPAWGA
jgi:Beta-lactamase